MMGNVTSNLIETAIQSANSENDSSLAYDGITTDSSKLEVYRLLRERMSDTETNQKSPTLRTDNNSSNDTANLVSVPAKEHVMMAPKKKFLIGYRGDEDELMCEKTGSGNFGGEVVAKVYPTPLSTSADVVRSRSHTVSLPFRSRGPPQTQSEVPRRPLIESKPVDAVRSGSELISPCHNPAPTHHTDASVTMLKPQRAMVEPAAPITHSASVSHDVRPVQGGYPSVDKNLTQQLQLHQRLTPGISCASSSYSPRGSQQYHRDSVGMMEGGGSDRQMTQVVQHVRDRPLTFADPGPGLVEHSGRYVRLQVSEPHGIGVKYDPPVATHPVLERQLDRRFVPPGGTDRPPLQIGDRHFVVPSEYWKETAVDERRKVARQMDHREMRTTVGHDHYMPQLSVSNLHCVDPANTVSERVAAAAAASHYTSTDNSLLPSDNTAGSYHSRSAEFARSFVGQHMSVDSCRHNSGVVDLPVRESRASRPHYDMGDVRKYPTTEAQMLTEYSGSIATADIQYNRHQLREPVLVPTGGGTEAEHYYHYRRPGPHPAPLQPVEPCVRPRIAGLTHGDPLIYEPPLTHFDSSRYPPDHTYRSNKYDVVERPRPSSDVLVPFVPSEPKQARRHSPYYSLSGATRTSSATSVTMGTGLSSGSLRMRGDSIHRVTSESPLDLTVRKEQSMTAEAFLRRCSNSSHSSSQYSSPSRHPTELQYSGYPSHYWKTTSNEGFEASPDVRQRMVGTTSTALTESSYPGHVGQWSMYASRTVRDYPQHLDPDVRRHGSYQHQRRPDINDHLLYSRRDTDPRWDSTRQPGSSMTTSPVVKPTYWDGRFTSQPIQTNIELSEGVADSRSRSSTKSHVGDVGWMGDRSQYGTRFAKSTDTEPTALSVDHRMHTSMEMPLALSPHNVPTTTPANRRIRMVELLGGKYSPSDILNLCCKFCGSTYGSLRSFRMHFAKAHGQEPTPENFTIQTISDARIQAMSQRTQETRIELDSPPTLQIESLEPAATNVGRDVAVAVSTDPHMRNAGGVCEFPTVSLMKPRSVAEVQPMQKSNPTILVDQGPPTPVSKPSLDEGTKRCGEDRRMKCKKCGHFSTQDLSLLRQHVQSHGTDSSPVHWSTTTCSCECSDTLDSDTGCAVCLEGFNDVSDWQHHVTSQHMMRSCICKSCDLGFTNASALRRHLTTTHGVHSPTGSSVKVEYRCLFCPEAFMDEHSLYAHTRAHEQHYSTQREHHPNRGTPQMCVQTAVPDTTCSEDQKTLAADVSLLDAAATCTAELETTGKRTEFEVARKNVEQNDPVTMQKSTATFDVRLNSKKASILRRLSVDANLTSSAVTSSSSSSSSVGPPSSLVKSAQSRSSEVEVCVSRQQPPVVFGDLLSSMHREVESTLRQFASSDTPTTSAPTPLTSATTLSTSPCVRDVCDAIIVHALQQRDVAQTGSYSPRDVMSAVQQRLVDADNLERPSRMTDPPQSVSHQSDGASSVEVDIQQQRQTVCFVEPSKPQQSCNMDTLIMNDTRSHVIDSESSSCLTDSRSRLTESDSDVLKNWSDIEGQGSHMTESKPVFLDCEVEPILPDVVEVAASTVTAAAAADGGDDDDGDMKKTEAIVSSHEADDADIDDHPLCIDLNREPSPDGDTISDH